MKETTLHKQQLADFLETVPDEKFVMDAWFNHVVGLSGDPHRSPKEFLDYCGTTACVAGWMTYLWPEFKGILQGSIADTLRVDAIMALGDKLGLNYEKRWALFYNYDAPRQDQIALLRKWIAEETPDTVVVFAIIPRDRALVTQGESHAN